MRVHRTTPEPGYTPFQNWVLQDERLSFGARGLLVYLVSLEDGTRVDIKTLAAEHPDGQRAIAGFMRELVKYGYMIRRRIRDVETYEIKTTIDVFDLPQTPVKDLEMVMSDQLTSGAEGASFGVSSEPPTGEKNGENPPEPLPMDLPEDGGGGESSMPEEHAASAALLTRIGRLEPRLALGVLEMLPLLPLVTEWRLRGATDAHVVTALTMGLPRVIYQPVSLLRSRLERKMPSAVAVRPPVVYEECPECRRPSRGLCWECRGVEVGMPSDVQERTLKGVAKAREMLAMSRSKRAKMAT